MASFDMEKTISRLKNKLSKLLDEKIDDINDDLQILENQSDMIQIPLKLFKAIKQQQSDILSCLEEYQSTLDAIRNLYIRDQSDTKKVIEIQNEEINLFKKKISEQQVQLSEERAINKELLETCSFDQEKIKSLSEIIRHIATNLQ